MSLIHDVKTLAPVNILSIVKNDHLYTESAVLNVMWWIESVHRILRILDLLAEAIPFSPEPLSCIVSASQLNILTDSALNEHACQARPLYLYRLVHGAKGCIL